MVRVYKFEERGGLGSDRADLAALGEEDDLLFALGITNGQLALLYVLENQLEATRSEIAFALVMDEWTVTLNIQALEALNAVIPTIRKDGRTRAFRLTPSGNELLKAGIGQWRVTRLTTPLSSLTLNQP
ncbi:MarR family winged helix-turn-helix transcriptional regulator [Rhizobium mesoamericanum]|uniref:MarR family winged helix-turn-helix transcriptional regulator n=1 Tax=Rhizobium mesoamericanum TaxID=1079800 RepID=UPI00040B6445|nr:MarR family winged helix-turn-helix transcriptional regulator [Rhizobium mesoamericanum]